MGKYDKALKIFWRVWWVGAIIILLIVVYQSLHIKGVI